MDLTKPPCGRTCTKTSLSVRPWLSMTMSRPRRPRLSDDRYPLPKAPRLYCKYALLDHVFDISSLFVGALFAKCRRLGRSTDLQLDYSRTPQAPRVTTFSNFEYPWPLAKNLVPPPGESRNSLFPLIMDSCRKTFKTNNLSPRDLRFPRPI
jgi:hypothetical protein